MDALVSVIVPVYKVEQYLQKCVSSITNQTYNNLEIILVDDGSPDHSGQMCDQMALHDRRIKVIHQNNQGLSEARNHGIDTCEGEYILFVDGDDYIEPNTVECLLRACIETSADVSCCGYVEERNTVSHPLLKSQKSYENEEIIEAELEGVFALFAWNKLWKRQLFDSDIRFPPGRHFEDISTNWKCFLKCHRVTCVPDILFHYVFRKDSISNTKSIKNLVDRWIAFKERFDEMAKRNEKLVQISTNSCLDTIAYTWRWLHGVQKSDRKEYETLLQEMRCFVKNHQKYMRHCPTTTRIALFCALHSNSITIFCCYYLNQFYRKMKGMGRLD